MYPALFIKVLNYDPPHHPTTLLENDTPLRSQRLLNAIVSLELLNHVIPIWFILGDVVQCG
ncbi:hypothetical protein TIFTF001_047930 [Ficus carica]|uniref:Uncharacterized protein n=1 Tax=Ficus carica TaxID=3494 RepID=A0AA87Z4C3_FICCA|nr:hypothetical protein TIFTF001_047930 [Ficus carica]